MGEIHDIGGPADISKYIDKTIDHWQRVLNLGQWDIEWKVCDLLSSSKSLMEIVPTRARNQAKIFIRKNTISSSSRLEIEKLLIHELCHLVLEPLVEEHLFELEFSIDGPRKEECRARFTRVLEKTVERTALMVYEIAKQRIDE